MKAKRKGARYVVAPVVALRGGVSQLAYDLFRDASAPLPSGELARLLNAGERAKAEVKRLKGEASQLIPENARLRSQVDGLLKELASLRAARRAQLELECTCDVEGHYEFCGLYRGGA